MSSVPLRVLILEDRRLDAELILQELRRAGFTPIWERVEDEPSFLAALTRPHDVICADYSMPQFDALRALALLRERRLDIPFASHFTKPVGSRLPWPYKNRSHGTGRRTR